MLNYNDVNLFTGRLLFIRNGKINVINFCNPLFISSVLLTVTAIVMLISTFYVYITGNSFALKTVERRYLESIETVKHDTREKLNSIYTDFDNLSQKVSAIEQFSNSLSERTGFNFVNDLKENKHSLSYASLDDLNNLVDKHFYQLQAMDKKFQKFDFGLESLLDRVPIKDKEGYLTSSFGVRIDPFTGIKKMHSGEDYVAKVGAEIIATGTGLVTWAARRGNYGIMVEIDHGRGVKTRYAHASKVLVRMGDFVHKGTTIALLGNTGRSTAPHVHYEVLYNNIPIHPNDYHKNLVQKLNNLDERYEFN